MGQFLLGYVPLLDIFLLHLILAYAQYIVLKAGVFSLATVGLAAVGAYTAGILAVRFGVHPLVGIPAAIVMSVGVALLLSLPLARLRGVYQAIATVAFIQIVVSMNLYAEDLTGGPGGLNGIPRYIGTEILLLAAAVTVWFVWAVARSRIGRTFDAIRQDEAVAASLGVRITAYQALGFALSGALAGFYGALEAYHSYALDPGQFGFPYLIAVLSYVVLGGRSSVLGPIVGTAVLVLLPEISRPMAENRILVFGAMLIIVINFLPRGIADTVLHVWRNRRLASSSTVSTKAT